MKLSRFATHWVPVIAIAGAIPLVSLLPPGSVPLSDVPHGDKLIHFCVFATLSLMLIRALGVTVRLPLAISVVLAAGGTTLYGVLDELQQMLFPHRHTDIFDLLADMCGATLGALAWAALSRWRAARTSAPEGEL